MVTFNSLILIQLYLEMKIVRFGMRLIWLGMRLVCLEMRPVT